MTAAWRAVLVVLAVVGIAFVLMRLLPADPAALMASAPGMGAGEVEELRRQLGGEQGFLSYLGGVLTGDWGRSQMTGQPVLADLARRLPASLELALAGFLLALGVTLGCGRLLSARLGGRLDRALGWGIGAISALPVFVTGLLLIQIFYVQLGWAPEPTGRLAPLLTSVPHVTGFGLLDAALARRPEALWSAGAQMVLPAVVLAAFAVGPMVRVFRAGLWAADQGAGARGARAIGLPEAFVRRRYILPEALGGLVPVAVVSFGYMLGASVLVEKVFAWPGIGRYAVEAMAALDFAAVQGVLLVLALAQVILALGAEGIARRLDPRLRSPRP